jgi:hypothetical protein
LSLINSSIKEIKNFILLLFQILISESFHNSIFNVFIDEIKVTSLVVEVSNQTISLNSVRRRHCLEAAIGAEKFRAMLYTSQAINNIVERYKSNTIKISHGTPLGKFFRASKNKEVEILVLIYQLGDDFGRDKLNWEIEAGVNIFGKAATEWMDSYDWLFLWERISQVFSASQSLLGELAFEVEISRAFFEVCSYFWIAKRKYFINPSVMLLSVLEVKILAIYTKLLKEAASAFEMSMNEELIAFCI